MKIITYTPKSPTILYVVQHISYKTYCFIICNITFHKKSIVISNTHVLIFFIFTYMLFNISQNTLKCIGICNFTFQFYYFHIERHHWCNRRSRNQHLVGTGRHFVSVCVTSPFCDVRYVWRHKYHNGQYDVTWCAICARKRVCVKQPHNGISTSKPIWHTVRIFDFIFVSQNNDLWFCKVLINNK